MPSHAFLETALGGVTKSITAAYDKAYQEFMKLQAIEQTRTLVQNYNESKRFYDRMKEISDYKGGIGAYVSDNIKSSIDKNNADKYWQMEYDFMRADPEDTAYVKKWISDVDKKVDNKFDYSKEIHAINLKRDKSIKDDIIAKAKDKSLKQEDRDRIAFQAAITQLEVTNEMNKNLQQLLILENERQAKEWAVERKASIEQEKLKDVIEKMYKTTKKTRPTDPYKVIEELPR
jgi:hypothetical protein